jgi:hypothetical protein
MTGNMWARNHFVKNNFCRKCLHAFLAVWIVCLVLEFQRLFYYCCFWNFSDVCLYFQILIISLCGCAVFDVLGLMDVVRSSAA